MAILWLIDKVLAATIACATDGATEKTIIVLVSVSQMLQFFGAKRHKLWQLSYFLFFTPLVTFQNCQ